MRKSFRVCKILCKCDLKFFLIIELIPCNCGQKFDFIKTNRTNKKTSDDLFFFM